MKTLNRALDITVIASVLCLIFEVSFLVAGIIICSALILILPTMAQFDGDGNER